MKAQVVKRLEDQRNLQSISRMIKSFNVVYPYESEQVVKFCADTRGLGGCKS
jgi:hypothetical protein